MDGVATVGLEAQDSIYGMSAPSPTTEMEFSTRLAQPPTLLCQRPSGFVPLRLGTTLGARACNDSPPRLRAHLQPSLSTSLAEVYCLEFLLVCALTLWP